MTPPTDTNAPSVTFAGTGAGGSTNEVYATEPINYTITFDEPHAPELTAGDLENALGGMTVESFVAVTGTYHVLQYQVTVTPSGSGMQLRMRAGTSIDDLFGNTLATPVADNDVFTIDPLPGLKGDCEIWKPWANGRINPATGVAWANGDQFRLVFASSGTRDATSTNIADYNSFLQAAAEASAKYEKLGNATWYVIGSTADVDARDNTETNPGEDGTGVAIFLLDGYTKVVDNNSDLWDGSLDNRINTDEEGGPQSGDVGTGSDSDGTGRNAGTSNDRCLGGSSEVPPKVTVGSIYSNWIVNYNQSASGQFRFYAMSSLLTVRAPGGTIIRIK